MGGTLSADDSVLDKPYSDPRKATLIDYFWSGKHKRSVKGINLITLYYTDIFGVSVPVNYRLYDKSSGKTKNDYFREMLLEVLAWGISPAWVTGDSWYSSLDNLKFIRKQTLNFMFGIASNRIVSVERGQYIQIQKLEGWSDSSHTVYLKNYGRVKVYRQMYKKSYRYYIIGMAHLPKLNSIDSCTLEQVHASHWRIEQFHRAIKQVCNVERFQVRRENPIRNHIFCALKAFVRLAFMRFDQKIAPWYEVKRDLFLTTMRHFIVNASQNYTSVNA